MKPRDLRRFSAFVVSAILISLSASQAYAQEGSRALEEIVVTAAYREQGLQDVPVSISAVTGDMMARAAIQKAEDIQFLVPNFTLTETGIGTNAFIRGIGSGINQAFEQSVGTYIDGVYFGRAQQWRSPFLDVERVEVLRGPQSILFGKNSVAGALNITTAKPTDEFEGSISASYEMEHEETILEGVLSGPITDSFRYRIAARTRELDGYMDNVTLGATEPNREDWTVRGTLEWDMTDNLTATLKAEVSEFDVAGRHIEIINEQPAIPGTPFAPLRYHQILQTLQAMSGQAPDPTLANVDRDDVRTSNGDFSNNDSETFVLTLDWGIGDYNLESITASSNFEYDEFCDCDFTGADVFGAALQESYDQFSQEFRLSSPLDGNFDYIAGVYYQTSEHEFADQIIVSPQSLLIPAINLQSGTIGDPTDGSGPAVANTMASRTAGVDNDVLSAFAQFNWHVSDNFTVQVGGRVTKDERDGFRSLSIVSGDGSDLPAAQIAAPLVYGSLFGITSTNLIPLSQLPVPALAGPANALLYGVDVSGGAPVPCTSEDPTCLFGLGVLPVEGSRDKTTFSPEVKLVWTTSADNLWYLSWSEGFKSGSFDFRANNMGYPRNFTMSDSFEFDDEEASNIELGGKLLLAGGAMELNMAAFFTQYTDLQVSIFDGTLGFNVGNAAEAEIMGLELDMRWAATDHLTISGGLAFIDFEFTDFPFGQKYFGNPDPACVGDLCPYTGKSNQMVSDVQGNVSFDYRVAVGRNLEIGALLDVFYTSEYDASATYDPALVQDAYTMLNARLSIGSQSGRWEIAALAKNLTDERVLSFGGDTPLAGSTFGAKSNYSFWGRGQTLSLQGTVRF
jgi:outer membrane receptor protein involved in Fe transport